MRGPSLPKTPMPANPGIAEFILSSPELLEAFKAEVREGARLAALEADHWLDRKQAAAHMKISTRTLAKHIDDWGLPQFGPAVKCFYKPDLDALMLANIFRARGPNIIPFPSIPLAAASHRTAHA